MLLAITCFLPSRIPLYFSFTAAGMATLIIGTILLKKEWLDGVIRLSLFMTIPFLVYIGITDTVPWLTLGLEKFYNACFGIAALFVILTLKFTRRQEGFKSTPMDFLILFIALVLPNLPDMQIKSYHLGILTARIIVFLFSYEVLIGELRKKDTTLSFSTVLILIIVSVRGLYQL